MVPTSLIRREIIKAAEHLAICEDDKPIIEELHRILEETRTDNFLDRVYNLNRDLLQHCDWVENCESPRRIAIRKLLTLALSNV